VDSKHFRIEQLAEGVFAALHRDGGWAIGNAGIIDMGDKTVVFDSSMSAASAVELRDAAERLTRRPVTHLVNSHYHNDHTWGNQHFDSALVIASAKTRGLMLTKGKEEVETFTSIGPTQLRELRRRKLAEADEDSGAELQDWIEYFEGIVDTTPKLSQRLPDLTFDGRLVLYGSRRSVELISFENGHTGCDTIMLLPEERIAFLADLLFVDNHPFIGDGDYEALLRALDEIDVLGLSRMVPGHGPVGDASDLNLLKEYIEDLNGIVSGMLGRGRSQDEIPLEQIPPRYANWRLKQFFQPNLRAIWAIQTAVASSD
jgi:glyoxylase-like metal-dependent hydrolase (beta-lactamase superfamily II)